MKKKEEGLHSIHQIQFHSSISFDLLSFRLCC